MFRVKLTGASVTRVDLLDVTDITKQNTRVLVVFRNAYV
jgi:hypothetical protein